MEKIAVLIPCYNEELTIKKVIKKIKKELPEATIYLYDNNSTDDSVNIALKEGVIVRHEIRQGKGNVVKTMFKEVDAECYVMIDADDTYSVDNIREMCNLILNKKYDIVIGDRLSSNYFKENNRLFHNCGNKIVRLLINKSFKCNVKDVMSGFRAFTYEFVKSCPVLAKSFEIETEMTIYAVDNNFRIGYIPVDYKNRIDGSVSKLKTYKDGRLVIKTILKLLKQCKPRLFFNTISTMFLVLSLAFAIPFFKYYIENAVFSKTYFLISIILFELAFILFVVGIILEVIVRKSKEQRELILKLLKNKYKP